MTNASLSVPAANRLVARADNEPSDRAGLDDQIGSFEYACAELAKIEATRETQTRFADAVARERALRQGAIALKETEKRPFLAECARIDAAHRQTLERLARALGPPKAKLDAFLIAAEEKRAQAEQQARLARAEAEAAAPDDPFAAFDAEEAAARARALAQSRTRASSSVGRGVSVRAVKSVEVVDYALAFAAVCETPAVKAAIDKAVNALGRAQGYRPISGCRIVETKAVR